jgi:subtilisin family serine protease
MKKLDPRLRIVVEKFEKVSPVPASYARRIGAESLEQSSRLELIVQCDLDGFVRLRDEGVSLRSWVAGVAVADVAIGHLNRLASEECITRIEASRPVFTDLDLSRQAINAPRPATAPYLLAQGSPCESTAAVAIIDSGVDVTHRRLRDLSGRSRVSMLWDQRASRHEHDEHDVPYGKAFDNRMLTEIIFDEPADTRPTDALVDLVHGTHVAGVAAGSLLDAHDSHFGVAPNACVLAVALAGRNGSALSRTPQLVDALHFVMETIGREPVVVNLSLSTTGGGRGGESPIEVALDALTRLSGVAVVCSAGNERESRLHAGGLIGRRATIDIPFDVPLGGSSDEVIELWIGNGIDVSVAVRSPAGETAAKGVRSGERRSASTPIGNHVVVMFDDDGASSSGDRRCFIFLLAGGAAALECGKWHITLRSGRTGPKATRWDAWIDRTAFSTEVTQTRFDETVCDTSRTLSSLATASGVIAVGSFASRSLGNASLGNASSFSSEGPSRRADAKPDIYAPGEIVVAAAPRGTETIRYPYSESLTLMAGTSVAAAHAAGAAALLLGAHPHLSGDQVRGLLIRSARQGIRRAADSTIDHILDVDAALHLAAIESSGSVVEPPSNNRPVSGKATRTHARSESEATKPDRSAPANRHSAPERSKPTRRQPRKTVPDAALAHSSAATSTRLTKQHPVKPRRKR